jgi:hypothetical protein
MKLKVISLMTAVFVLGGCEYAGPAGDPVSRNVSWFDYVGGESLKAACGPGGSTRLRFVYNGIYDQQIRSYDVRVLRQGRSAALSAWTRGDGDLTKGVVLTNLLSPWQGTRVESVMNAQAVSDLRAALVKDRFASFKPVGLRLPSNEFYWVAVGCIDGRFHANAWMYPSDRFKNLTFPGILLANDRTGIEFRKSRPVNQREDDPTRHEGDRNPSDSAFQMQLGPDGFVGAKGLF